MRAGDERAFAELVEALTPGMLRVARDHVASHAVADEVVQETWLGVLGGLDAFEGRASLKTWIYRILVNQATSRGVRERRTVPFASLAGDDGEGDPLETAEWPHHWATPPARWEASPEASLAHGETLEVVSAAIDTLPPAQRAVIVLHDLEGFASGEIGEILDSSPGNVRVLLHRARARVRERLEAHLAP